MGIQIIADSTADLLQAYQSKATIVPLTIRFGDQEYADGVELSKQAFYEKLVESDQLPTTSQVPPQVYEEAFRKVAEAGDVAIVITIASKLSGTYQSAVIASENYKDRIFVVDSKTAAIGTGILVQHAIDLKEQGLSAEEIVAELNEVREKICLVALVDTLEYLKRGGRVSKTVAFAGGLLSIKPVISVADGEIKMLGKARGSKQGNNLLVQEITKAGGVDFTMPLMLGYTGLSDALLKKYIEDSAALWQGNTKNLPVSLISGVIGTHAGPGAVAVAFFKK